jgi:drug/metabolite transporter (DMT)-like permease
MINNITLSIHDKNIEKEYIKQNSKKIFWTLVLLQVLRTIKTLIAYVYAKHVPSAEMNLNTYIYFGWVLSLAQLAIFPLQYKLPMQMSRWSIITWMALSTIGIGPTIDIYSLNYYNYK